MSYCQHVDIPKKFHIEEDLTVERERGGNKLPPPFEPMREAKKRYVK